MRLIDADLLRKNMEFICMGIMAGTEPYNAPLTEIDNAPTVEVSENAVNCVLTEFGNCSYNKTGCSDCEIKDKIRKALEIIIRTDARIVEDRK